MHEQIKTLISENRLFEAIKQIHDLKEAKKHRKDLAQIEGRLNGLNEKIRLGVLSEEIAGIELNKIRSSILDVYHKLHLDDDYARKKHQQHKKKKTIIAAVGVGALLIISLFIFSEKNSCDNRKIAVLIADFQNTSGTQHTDEFSNNLATILDIELEDDIYDVSPVGHQSRQVKKYDEYIRKEHFESACDTSGIFINGLISLEHEIFNIYMTIVNLTMTSSELPPDNAIKLANPSGLVFKIKDDSKFFADFVLAILKAYEGDPYNSLERILELEKNDSSGVIKNDQNFRATVAYFKGNAYAMRGDEKRAKAAYQVVEKYGNPELKKAAEENSGKAENINSEMRKDPVLKAKLNKNISEHAGFEAELARFFRNLERGVGKILKGLKK